MRVRKSELTLIYLSAGSRNYTSAELAGPRAKEILAVNGVVYGPLPRHYSSVQVKHPDHFPWTIDVDLSGGQIDQLTIDDPRIVWKSLPPGIELVD